MSSAADQLGQRARASLQKGVRTARTLMAELAVSQPTLSRALRTLGADLVPFGVARSIQYALRDATRQDLQAPVYRVSVEGQLRELGVLIPVYPDGFVMVQADGLRLHTEGLPWWLFDMQPQGYLGRAFNLQHGQQLGLPAYSGPNRPHDPIQTHQSFRFKPATHSGLIRSTYSVSDKASHSGLNPPLWAGC